MDVSRSNHVHITITIENVEELVPPAFSLCSDDIDFRYDCNTYGENLANCQNLVRTVNVSNDDTYNSWFTKCDVFQTTQPMLFSSQKIQPKDWSSHHSPLFIQYLFRNVSSSSPSSKVFFMLWNPYDLPNDAVLSTETTPQILNPYRIINMDAMRERVYSFYWRKHIFLNGTEKFNLDYKLELDASTNLSTLPIGLVHFKPASFNMTTTREYFCFPTFSAFTMFMVLLAVFNIYWGLFSGKGKYKTWGFAHVITSYYPQQHILPMENIHALKPTADDVLRVYLHGLDRAEFEKK
ncbi:1194_t:CDS:1 [Funneliformis geosporum]|uniref:12798_t:CDS:1 n=1 Tax=Funneliformis geosporum TaxID=1117311 RepID=A0A9W4SN07_9GLOM|nr:12798_t:CDS:1 [Funneliformis geosporum]CAI2191071.1 1194_t:CDS:1 [Funneliformis geosporum]